MKKIIENFEEILCAGFISFMVLLVVSNVFLRYVFSTSITWSEEVSTICFVWATFLGASAVYKHKMDIGIDVLIKKTPVHIQTLTKTLVNIILLLINGYIFYMSIIFTYIALDKPTAVLGWSSAVFNLALVVGFGLITFHTLRFLKEDLMGVKA